MMKKLPHKEFQWIDADEIASMTEEDIVNYDSNGDYGMVLEVSCDSTLQILENETGFS